MSLRHLALFSVFASLTACSHGPTVQDYPPTASPADEVKNLDTDLRAGVAAQLNVLSPHNFADAESALSDAQRSLEKQKDAKDILHHVAEGRAYLVLAHDSGQLAQSRLEDVVAARKNAIDAGAPGNYPKEFGKADEALRGVTGDVEKNDLGDVQKKRAELQGDYLGLELKSIQKTSLEPAREIMDTAAREDARHFAPRSLALAEKQYDDTNAFIIGNRQDKEEIRTRSAQTLASAEHLLKITRDAKAGKKASPEDAALELEGEQNAVASKQAQLEVRQAQFSSQLSAEKSAVQTLQGKNAHLVADQAFEQRFEDARKQFTPAEAEVYKQGDRLTIRLKGLEFPTAQATLAGRDFPLLAKVQKVIQDFGQSNVTVEGHTDSLGSKLVNEKLSTDRAQAVREYLISNTPGADPAKISMIGYGDQRPLASNKTASGRAQNRRVDVIIQPETPNP